MSYQDLKQFSSRERQIMGVPSTRRSRKCMSDDHAWSSRAWVPRGIVLKLGGIMRRRMTFTIGMLVTLLALWTVGAHAVTFNVTDDTYSQQCTGCSSKNDTQN